MLETSDFPASLDEPQKWCQSCGIFGGSPEQWDMHLHFDRTHLLHLCIVEVHLHRIGYTGYNILFQGKTTEEAVRFANVWIRVHT